MTAINNIQTSNTQWLYFFENILSKNFFQLKSFPHIV